MNAPVRTTRRERGWLRRLLEVLTPEGAVFLVEYNGRGMGYESVSVNGELVARSSGPLWFVPRFEFFLGPRRAALEVRIGPLLNLLDLHLLIDGQVVYCDRQARTGSPEPDEPAGRFGESAWGPAGEVVPACVHCGRAFGSRARHGPSQPVEVPAGCGSVEPLTVEFTTPTSYRAVRLVGGPALFLLGAGLLGVLWAAGHWQGSLLGFLLALAGLFICVAALRSRGAQVLAGPKGLARVEGGEVEVFRWDEVTAVRERMTAGGGNHQPRVMAWAKGEDHVLELQCADGRCLVLRKCVEHFDTLVALVKHYTREWLMPEAMAAFHAGERLSFGPITVDREGVHCGEEMLPWREVESLEVSGGKVTIRRSDKWLAWFSVPVGEVPNAHVLAALAWEARQRPGPPDESYRAFDR
ncbi:MAG: hypothetical protein L0Z62_37175 [Gemmataceae bacterium]|nr:hypothetical protein [Gemmataceae bacterium]